MNDFNYSPEILDISIEKDRKRYNDLLNIPGLRVHDEIMGQIIDVLNCRFVKKQFSVQELQTGHYRDLLDIPWNDLSLYGVWVYYSWSNRLVHLLPEREFIEIRTNRNRYKITQSEQDELSGKVVGVVGLSVGQSVSVTLAMERACGVLKLADMDTLELSNLNRIRTGLHNLGVPKVISVAREIKEIDPFFEVEIYPDGLLDSNMEEFFLKGKKLDVIIDECDSIDVKLLLRLKARELKVPVLMEASDRGMIDIERFDLEPNRPILHGMVEHLDIEKVRGLETYEEKMPFMLPLVGVETLSTRMQASMLELQQTIRSWPQLASAVTYGGGLVADLVRRQFLGQLSLSGRFYIDVEELIGGESPLNDPRYKEGGGFKGKDRKEIIDQLNSISLPDNEHAEELSEDEKKQMIEAAQSAPSLSNCQPWFLYFRGKTLLLYYDALRSKTFWDSSEHASILSYGMMLENVVLKAEMFGYDVNIDFTQFSNETPWIECYFKKLPHHFSAAHDTELQLAKWLPLRETSRLSSIHSPVPENYVHLPNYLSHANFGLKFITGNDRISKLADILGEYEQFRLLNDAGLEDFIKEVRWSDQEAKTTGDGVDMETLYLSEAEKAGIGFLKNQRVHDYLKQWELGNGLAEIMSKIVRSAPLICLLYANKRAFDDVNLFRIEAGRQLERAWIAVNGLGMSFHPVSSSLILNNMLHYAEVNEVLNEKDIQFLQTHQEMLRTFFELEGDQEMVFIFKVFQTEGRPKRSYRRSFSEISAIH